MSISKIEKVESALINLISRAESNGSDQAYLDMGPNSKFVEDMGLSLTNLRMVVIVILTDTYFCGKYDVWAPMVLGTDVRVLTRVRATGFVPSYGEGLVNIRMAIKTVDGGLLKLKAKFESSSAKSLKTKYMRKSTATFQTDSVGRKLAERPYKDGKFSLYIRKGPQGRAELISYTEPDIGERVVILLGNRKVSGQVPTWAYDKSGVLRRYAILERTDVNWAATFEDTQGRISVQFGEDEASIRPVEALLELKFLVAQHFITNLLKEQ